MGFWPVIWSGNGPVIPSPSGNPQGLVAACVGSLAVGPDGTTYVKLGGGCTNRGWYLDEANGNVMKWQSRWTGAAFNNMMRARDGSGSDIGAAPTTPIVGVPTQSAPGSSVFSPLVQYSGGYTSGVAGNSFLYRLSAAAPDGMPALRMDGAITDFVPWDLYWDIVTTPRSSAASSSTDLTTNGMRIWAGIVWGTNTTQVVGGTVSSDTLQTEWPTAMTATAGLYGAAIRYSTVAADPGFVCVTSNNPGGVNAQTVTNIGALIAANTAYRLRMRCKVVSGVITLYASVNDGAETAITLNVGPGATALGATTIPAQLLASIRQINGTVKSLCAMETYFAYGKGV